MNKHQEEQQIIVIVNYILKKIGGIIMSYSIKKNNDSMLGSEKRVMLNNCNCTKPI